MSAAGSFFASLIASIRGDSPLKSAVRVEREKALEARRQDIAGVRDKELARLAEEQRRVREEHAAAVAEAEAATKVRADELDAALAADIIARVYPVVARFVAEPRATAIKLTEVWRELEARAQLELGESLAVKHIALAILASASGDALARGGNDRWFADSVRTGSSLGRALESGAGPAAVEQALRDLEVGLAKALAVEPVGAYAADARRVAVLQGHSTMERLMAAAASHDRKVEAERREADRPAQEAHHAKWAAEQEKNRGTALGQQRRPPR